MSFHYSAGLRAARHYFPGEDTKTPEPTSPIFHNLPWLPSPPMAETPFQTEPTELPGSIPRFELPGSMPRSELPASLPQSKVSGSPRPWNPEKIIYASVYPTTSPPPYSLYPPPSPALSTTSTSSNSIMQSRMYSSNSHPARATRSLRRKHAPQDLSLRQLRIKESEIELKRWFEGQTDRYLEGW
jgi:hypothetical protein